MDTVSRGFSAFNSGTDVGLRALTILTEAYPSEYDLQRLVIFDYFTVHSDDLPGGPKGLHPQTPHRSGELLVRRNLLQDAIRLYESRDLLRTVYREEGIRYRATDLSGSFLDTLDTKYARALRDRAAWIVATYGDDSLESLQELFSAHLGEWGAEFEMESVLWKEEL